MEHILSLSYGKDSLACLGAIEELGWPLDRIIHSEIWATKDIQADYPSIEDYFYLENLKGKYKGRIHGFPMTYKQKAWCNKRLKIEVLQKYQKEGVWYLGIAADEEERFSNLNSVRKSPLVEIGWDEKTCRKWCEDNDLLSPIYTTSNRGGCWFCHNQPLDQLRILRRSYPEYWSLLLKWDKDSLVSFKADGRSVHDYDKRFELEDKGLIPKDRTFRWKMLDEYKGVVF